MPTPREPEPVRPTGNAPDPLGLSAPEMRRLGYQVVDQVVDHWAQLADGPAVGLASARELAEALGGGPPNEPGDPESALRLLADTALVHMQHAAHPRYFARVPSPAAFAAILGEWLGTGFNAIASSWAGGSGPTAVELVVVDWLRDLVGLPPQTEGVLVSGGSMGNITALAAARHAGFDGVLYLSDQTHSSILRGLRGMGWPDDLIRVVRTGSQHRWEVSDVASAIDADLAEGRHPAIVVATAGTTNTGAVDPLAELADLCTLHHMWFHVDGAYGAPAAMTARGRAALSGIERADSLTLDPHKWLFQPYDVGCVLVRRPGVLEACYAMNPEYLRDVTADTDEVDLRNRSLELSRRSRALKLWLTFHTYGLDAIRAAVAHGIGMAETAQALLESDARWEVVTPARLGVVTFSRRGITDEEHVRRAAALTVSGFAAVSTTELAGRTVFRLCTINPTTAPEDVAGTLARLVEPVA